LLFFKVFPSPDAEGCEYCIPDVQGKTFFHLRHQHFPVYVFVTASSDDCSLPLYSSISVDRNRSGFGMVMTAEPGKRPS
jgi:hypothetical protein